jgi:cell division septum initiation protein DivIVA
MESEILALIDHIEELLSTGGRVPLSSRVMVQANEAFQLLDQMRQALPREVVRARHIYQERDRILQEAQTEAEALRAAARAEREALVADHAILLEATAAAEALRTQTRRECDHQRAEADTYTLQALRELSLQLDQTHEHLEATIKTTQGGMALLRSRMSRAIKADRERVALEEE